MGTCLCPTSGRSEGAAWRGAGGTHWVRRVLLLAFGLTMAVGRYDSRRNAVVLDANTIGTTYLRAQTLAEPMRTESLSLLRRYADARVALSESVPDSAKFQAVVGDLRGTPRGAVGASR